MFSYFSTNIRLKKEVIRIGKYWENGMQYTELNDSYKALPLDALARLSYDPIRELVELHTKLKMLFDDPDSTNRIRVDSANAMITINKQFMDFCYKKPKDQDAEIDVIDITPFELLIEE